MTDTEPASRPSSANGLKRRRTESFEQESKRQRTSSGKTSPPTEDGPKGKARDTPNEAELSTKPEEQQAGRKEPTKRKSVVTDEKQRSRRLFGSLLGNLNQPGDRTGKRRQEIEARRKAELQRQDDERLEDKQRRAEKLVEQRRKAQVKVDEENMRVSHAQMLNTANFLQTKSEPKLYYRPWDLRADEEDRIDEQLRDAQTQIDDELAELEERQMDGDGTGVRPDDAQRTSDLDHKPNTAKEAEQGPLTSAETQEIAADGGAQDKSEDTNEEKPAEVSDSQEGDITNDAHDAFDRAIADSKAKPEEEEKHPNDEGDHVVEGEEDTVIY